MFNKMYLAPILANGSLKRPAPHLDENITIATEIHQLVLILNLNDDYFPVCLPNIQ